MAERVEKCLSRVFNNVNNIFVPPEFPLFSGEGDPLFRACIAVILGCNVYPGGVKGIGPAKLNNMLRTLKTQQNNNILDKLLMAIAKNDDDDHAALETLSMAFCYEPSNDEDKANISPVYLYEKPTMFTEYLSEYAPMDGSILIEKGPAYRVCKGFGPSDHKYLEIEGTHTCSMCASVVCCFCCMTHGNTTK